MTDVLMKKKRKCDHRNIDVDKAERLGKGCHVWA